MRTTLCNKHRVAVLETPDRRDAFQELCKIALLPRKENRERSQANVVPLYRAANLAKRLRVSDDERLALHSPALTFKLYTFNFQLFFQFRRLADYARRVTVKAIADQLHLREDNSPLWRGLVDRADAYHAVAFFDKPVKKTGNDINKLDVGDLALKFVDRIAAPVVKHNDVAATALAEEKLAQVGTIGVMRRLYPDCDVGDLEDAQSLLYAKFAKLAFVVEPCRVGDKAGATVFASV